MKRPSGMSRPLYLRLLLGFGLCCVGMALRHVGEWLMAIDHQQATFHGRPAPTLNDLKDRLRS